MNELIKIEERSGKESVSARDLHTALEVARDFSTWIKDRIEKYSFIEGRDYEVFTKSGENPLGGRPSGEYLLSVQMAKELATVEDNEKGREVRLYLIKVEEAWNTPEMVIARGLQAASEFNRKLLSKVAQLEPKAAFFDKVANSKLLIFF
jgi:anti-repressor protein